jgi:hypothetical protein
MLPAVRVAYASQPESLLQSMSTGLWIIAGLSPLVAGLKALLLGGVGWAVLVLAGALPRFRTLVSTALYGEALLAVQGLWVALVLHLREGDRLTRPADLMVFTGLDVFVQDATSPLAALARGVSPFHAAWVVLLAVLFTYAARTTWRRGTSAALACWVVAIGLSALRSVAG